MKIRKIIAILAVFISLGILAACNHNGYLCLHNWSEWEIIDSPTCTNPGEEKRVCLVDETHVETRKLDPIGHDWGEWIITTPATDEDQGLETRICKNDNAHVETRRLGSTLSNEQPIGKNEQVKHNKFGYVVTEAGLWLGEQGEEYIVLGYSGKSKTVEIPAYVNNKPITVIGDGAYSEPAVVGYVPPIWTKYMFRDNKNITSITFEEGSMKSFQQSMNRIKTL